MSVSSSAARLARAALVAVLVLTALCLVPAGARAAGTGGIEVTPVPGQRDGKAITTFRVTVPGEGSLEVPFTLRNLEKSPRTARIYVARVDRDGDDLSLGDPGSSPYAALADDEVTLKAGEVQKRSFRVTPGPDGPPDGEALAAVVVEVRNGVVVQRANTLIYLKRGPVVPLPLVVLLAAVMVIVIGFAVLFSTRSQRARRAGSAEAGADEPELSSD